MISDIIKNTVMERLENALQDIEQDIKFVNMGGNKWQAVISFDLDSIPGLNDAEKMLINALLSHL